MTAGTIAVTGASGRLGGAVARLLARADARQILIGRSPERLPELPGAERRGPAEYADAAAMRAALTGADALLLVSGGLSPRRYEEHRTVIAAAQAAGVARVVYVSLIGASPVASFSHARDHLETEFTLTHSGLQSAILRPGYYASMLSAQADADHVIHGLSAEGRISAVGHADIAEVAAALLLGHAPTGAELAYDGAVYEVTGPEACTWDEITARLRAATGLPYRAVVETPEQSVARRALTEPDPVQIERWVSWHTSVARGEAAAVTDVVERITGHPPVTILDVLAAAPRP